VARELGQLPALVAAVQELLVRTRPGRHVLTDFGLVLFLLFLDLSELFLLLVPCL